MRILLIHPGTPAYGGKEDFRTYYPPLGLACIASPLLMAGHEVRIMDMGIETQTLETLVREAENFKPDIIGFRCMFITYPRGLTLAEAIRHAIPSCNIIFGGPHMGLVAEEVIRDHWHVDAVVQGEGELTLLQYIEALEKHAELKGVLGLVWRGPTGAIRNEARPVSQADMEVFPTPAFELLPMHLYKMMNFFALEGHRGCPSHCIFCSLPTTQTKTVRNKPPRRLVAEIERLVDDFGINRFEMIEVNFTINKSWVQEVCRLILEKRLPIQWIARSYPELVDKPTLALMREAGCFRIYYGIESGSRKVLKNFGKATTVEQSKQAILMGKEAGLDVYCDFLIGGPGETAQTVEETIAFARETAPHYAGVSLIAPFPGTPMYERASEFGIKLLEPAWYKDPNLVSQFPYVRAMELEQTSLKELESLWLRAVTQIVYRAKSHSSLE